MNFIHGDHLTKLYALWRNFRYRCTCPTSKDYPNYGKKGISVFEKWNDYPTFKTWALSSGYEEGLTIERKDNAQGYCPQNCIFTTTKENNRNKSTSRWWFIDGIRFISASTAAKHFNVGESTIQRWCNGFSQKNDKYKYEPKQNCYSEVKYADN